MTPSPNDDRSTIPIQDTRHQYIVLCLVPVSWSELKDVRLPDLREWQKQQYGSARIRITGEMSRTMALEFRFFLGADEYGADTSTNGNPAYLGSLGVSGMSKPNDYELARNGRPVVRIDLELDVTDNLLRSLQVHEPFLTLVPVSADGVTIEDAHMDAIWKPETVEFVIR